MTHEPECPDVDCKADGGRCAFCICEDDAKRAEGMHTAHDKDCFMSWPVTIDRPGLCICAVLRRSYTAGYNDHARTVQHWQDTHGAYRQQPPAPACPCCAPGGES